MSTRRLYPRHFVDSSSSSSGEPAYTAVSINPDFHSHKTSGSKKLWTMHSHAKKRHHHKNDDDADDDDDDQSGDDGLKRKKQIIIAAIVLAVVVGVFCIYYFWAAIVSLPSIDDQPVPYSSS
ncbi:hypothetical protein T439DRAFT_359884 [Meredithblackwellia eburnea MCA 4105]